MNPRMSFILNSSELQSESNNLSIFTPTVTIIGAPPDLESLSSDSDDTEAPQFVKKKETQHHYDPKDWEETFSIWRYEFPPKTQVLPSHFGFSDKVSKKNIEKLKLNRNLYELF